MSPATFVDRKNPKKAADREKADQDVKCHACRDDNVGDDANGDDSGRKTSGENGGAHLRPGQEKYEARRRINIDAMERKERRRKSMQDHWSLSAPALSNEEQAAESKNMQQEEGEKKKKRKREKKKKKKM